MTDAITRMRMTLSPRIEEGQPLGNLPVQFDVTPLADVQEIAQIVRILDAFKAQRGDEVVRLFGGTACAPLTDAAAALGHRAAHDAPSLAVRHLWASGPRQMRRRMRLPVKRDEVVRVHAGFVLAEVVNNIADRDRPVTAFVGHDMRADKLPLPRRFPVPARGIHGALPVPALGVRINEVFHAGETPLVPFDKAQRLALDLPGRPIRGARQVGWLAASAQAQPGRVRLGAIDTRRAPTMPDATFAASLGVECQEDAAIWTQTRCSVGGSAGGFRGVRLFVETLSASVAAGTLLWPVAVDAPIVAVHPLSRTTTRFAPQPVAVWPVRVASEVRHRLMNATLRTGLAFGNAIVGGYHGIDLQSRSIRGATGRDVQSVAGLLRSPNYIAVCTGLHAPNGQSSRPPSVSPFATGWRIMPNIGGVVL